MWAPWTGPMWGFWWIFPLMGLLLCLAFAVMAFRLITTGRGFMCMGGHQQSDRDESAALRREIQALREEIRQLKGPR